MREKSEHGLTSPPVLLISSANLFRVAALRAMRATLYPLLAKRRLLDLVSHLLPRAIKLCDEGLKGTGTHAVAAPVPVSHRTAGEQKLWHEFARLTQAVSYTSNYENWACRHLSVEERRDGQLFVIW